MTWMPRLTSIRIMARYTILYRIIKMARAITMARLTCARLYRRTVLSRLESYPRLDIMTSMTRPTRLTDMVRLAILHRLISVQGWGQAAPNPNTRQIMPISDDRLTRMTMQARLNTLTRLSRRARLTCLESITSMTW